jgi:hypothetical protein
VKKGKEQLLESAQKMLSKRDFSSLAVAHAVVLLKSHAPDHDIEKLWRDFLFNTEEERDALVDSVYDAAQYFVFQCDFSVLSESDDSGSPSA